MSNAEPTKVTIYNVAEEARVSIGTVSKVLSNKSGASEATRQKVWETAERLGYVPSLAARSLTGGRTGIVGLLVPYNPAQLFSDPHLLGNFHGIEEALNERDYNLLLATAQKEHDPASSYERLLRARYFDGVIVMETQESRYQELHRRLSQQAPPWVILGYPAGIAPCYSVYADDFQGGQLAAEHLLSLGHRRIGIVNADPRPSAFDERIRGYASALEAHGLSLDDKLMVYGDMTRESGYVVAPKLLHRPERPTAVFALNDRMALGLMSWAQENEICVPDELSVIGFDDIPDARSNCLSLTTIRQPAVEMGREAVHLLFRLFNGEKPPSRIVMATELVLRGTTTEPKVG